VLGFNLTTTYPLVFHFFFSNEVQIGKSYNFYFYFTLKFYPSIIIFLNFCSDSYSKIIFTFIENKSSDIFMDK